MPPSSGSAVTGPHPTAATPAATANGNGTKVPTWAMLLLAGALGGGGGGFAGYSTTVAQVTSTVDKVERLESALDVAERDITTLRIGAGRMETQQAAIQAQLGQIAGQLRSVDAKLDTMIEAGASRPRR